MMANWYEKHEFTIWAVIVLTLLVCFYALLLHPDVLWQLSNPVLRAIGGTPR